MYRRMNKIVDGENLYVKKTTTKKNKDRLAKKKKKIKNKPIKINIY